MPAPAPFTGTPEPPHRHCHLPESRASTFPIAPLHPLWGPADPLHVPVGLQDDGLGEGKRLAVRGISGSGGVQGACAAAGLFRGMASRCPGTVVAPAVAKGVATIVATRSGVVIERISGGVFGTGGFLGRSIPAAGGRLQHVQEHRGWSDSSGRGVCRVRGRGLSILCRSGRQGRSGGRRRRRSQRTCFNPYRVF